MLGNKITKHHIVKAFHNTRNCLGGAYSHGKNNLGSIENRLFFIFSLNFNPLLTTFTYHIHIYHQIYRIFLK